MVSNFHWDSCTETALFRTSSEELVFLHPKLEHTDHQEIFMLDANLMQFLFWLNSFFQCFWFLLEIVTFEFYNLHMVFPSFFLVFYFPFLLRFMRFWGCDFILAPWLIFYHNWAIIQKRSRLLRTISFVIYKILIF